MNTSVWGAQTPSTAQARDVAVWLLGEATARRMPPVVSAEPAFEYVRLTICPQEAWEWWVWCNLLNVDRLGITNWGEDVVAAHGQWEGVHVVLTGTDPGSWLHS